MHQLREILIWAYCKLNRSGIFLDVMTKYFFLLIPLFLNAAFICDNSAVEEEESKEIVWLSLEEAISLNEKSPKKFLINVVTEWCAACKHMGNTTYSSPEVIDYINNNFYAVTLDAQMKEPFTFLNKQFLYNEQLLKGGVHDLAVHLTKGNLTFPTTVFLDEYLVNPQPITGFQSTDQLSCLMAFFGENIHYETEWNVFKDFYSNKKSD